MRRGVRGGLDELGRAFTTGQLRGMDFEHCHAGGTTSCRTRTYPTSTRCSTAIRRETNVGTRVREKEGRPEERTRDVKERPDGIEPALGWSENVREPLYFASHRRKSPSLRVDSMPGLFRDLLSIALSLVTFFRYIALSRFLFRGRVGSHPGAFLRRSSSVTFQSKPWIVMPPPLKSSPFVSQLRKATGRFRGIDVRPIPHAPPIMHSIPTLVKSGGVLEVSSTQSLLHSPRVRTSFRIRSRGSM